MKICLIGYYIFFIVVYKKMKVINWYSLSFLLFKLALRINSLILKQGSIMEKYIQKQQDNLLFIYANKYTTCF